MSKVADRLCGDAGDLGGALEGPRFDVGGEVLIAGSRVVDKLPVLKPGVDDLPGHAVGQGDVGAHVDTQPSVGEPC